METSDYIEGGFILLSRKLNNNDSSFQYCRNNDHKWMFIMSLLMANYEDKVWRGIEIKRGQFLTSRKNFADAAHVKEQQVRDFWKNMQKAQFLTTKTTNRHTIITVCNYDRYQNLSNYIKEKQPTGHPSKNQQRTTTKEYIKKEKEMNDVQADNIVKEFFDYFLSKTRKKFTLTEERSALIASCLQTHTIEQLKQAVDNFVQDDWPDRHKYMDIVYCIGKQKGKLDNLERWLNWQPKKQERRFTS